MQYRASLPHTADRERPSLASDNSGRSPRSLGTAARSQHASLLPIYDWCQPFQLDPGDADMTSSQNCRRPKEMVGSLSLDNCYNHGPPDAFGIQIADASSPNALHSPASATAPTHAHTMASSMSSCAFISTPLGLTGNCGRQSATPSNCVASRPAIMSHCSKRSTRLLAWLSFGQYLPTLPAL